MERKIVKIVVAISIFILLFSQLGSAESSKAPVFPGVEKIGGTLVVLYWGDPKSFNPDAQVDDAGYGIANQIFSKLVTLDRDYNVIPDLAYKWEVSDDGKVYTFYLNPNATWHDGVPVTAEDVKWTFEAIKKYKGIAYGIIHADNIEKIEVVDNHTVRFYLKEPFAPFLSFIAWYGTFILPKHIYEKYDDWLDPSNPYLNKPIGSGPFKFVEWVKGDHITLVANENYFKGRPGIDKIIYKIIPDSSAALQAFLAGEGDVLGQRPPLTEIPRLKSTPGVSVSIRPVPSRWYLGFNLKRPYLQDVRVRQAIAYAINKEEIVEKAENGLGYPAEGTYVPAIKWAFNPNAKLPEYNPEKAKQLLDEAGFKDINGDGFRETPDGKPLELRLLYFTGSDTNAICTLIKEQLQKVGLKVKLESYEIATWEQKVVKDRDFDLALVDGFQGPDPANMEIRFKSTAYINFAGYNNTEFDKILEEAAKTTDKEKRKELYWKAQEILAKDLPYLPLVDLVAISVWRNEFHGMPWEDEAVGKVGAGVYAMVWWEKGKPIAETTSPTATSETSKASTATQETQTTTEEKKTCGPATLVGLALIPVLFRRKRKL
ncbi:MULTISPECIES: ABC transporter substrate-binding protein [unclassified Thermococcus]|uniref:ABC transporter substrate-binding protein n=1 Tax=unclassified Thermococcus TaxID=2627626 RepID=UPI001438C14F|nr:MULTISPECIES: ABC transporter substrate-binding protein [unclassified Thermococcus]